MKSKLIIIILTLSIFSSCKKTEVSGIVYSKHNIPVSGASVFISYRRAASSVDESTGITTTTNINGNYNLSFKSKNKYNYSVNCKSDSGSTWKNVKKKESNLIDLHLR